MSNTPPTQEDFLDGRNYDRHPTAKFPTIGTTIAGEIVDVPRVVYTEDSLAPLGADGKKPWSNKLVIAIADNTSGQTVAIWAKNQMATAIAKARDDASAKRQAEGGPPVTRIEQGGKLVIRFSAEGEVKTAGMNPPKLYEAFYAPPAHTATAAPAMTAGGTVDLASLA